MIIPVVMAGGSGTRLWPLSREQYPKQLLSFINKKTLLQHTLLRMAGCKDVADPVIICNSDHRFMIAEQCRAIDVTPQAMILEPMGRNTAPALAIATLYTLQIDPRAVMLVLPADHHIARLDQFQASVGEGYRLATSGHLIAFGVTPSAPETGYGYICQGAPLDSADKRELQGYRIERFVEKPDAATAQSYVDAGNYYWNSGMFMFRADFLQNEIEHLAQPIWRACEESYKKQRKDLDFIRLDHDTFAACPSDSIDYAIMEKTDKGAMVPLGAEWNDLGSWESLWQVGERDTKANVLRGDVLSHDIKECYINASSRLVAAVGLDRHVVVETADAVLISPRDRVQEVKQLVGQLKKSNRSEGRTHKTVYRPWGAYQVLDEMERCQVRRLTIKPGAGLTLQKHFNRAEHWVVLKGVAQVTKGDHQQVVRENESIYIPEGVPHRLRNPGKIELEVLEIQSGAYLGEDDVTRLEESSTT